MKVLNVYINIKYNYTWTRLTFQILKISCNGYVNQWFSNSVFSSIHLHLVAHVLKRNYCYCTSESHSCKKMQKNIAFTSGHLSGCVAENGILYKKYGFWLLFFFRISFNVKVKPTQGFVERNQGPQIIFATYSWYVLYKAPQYIG